MTEPYKGCFEKCFLTFTLNYKTNFYRELGPFGSTRGERRGPVLPARPTFPEVGGGKGGGGGGLNRGRSVGPKEENCDCGFPFLHSKTGEKFMKY